MRAAWRTPQLGGIPINSSCIGRAGNVRSTLSLLSLKPYAPYWPPAAPSPVVPGPARSLRSRWGGGRGGIMVGASSHYVPMLRQTGSVWLGATPWSAQEGKQVRQEARSRTQRCGVGPQRWWVGNGSQGWDTIRTGVGEVNRGRVRVTKEHVWGLGSKHALVCSGHNQRMLRLHPTKWWHQLIGACTLKVEWVEPCHAKQGSPGHMA